MTDRQILAWMKTHLDREAGRYDAAEPSSKVGPWPGYITREDALARFAGWHLELRAADQTRTERLSAEAWAAYDAAVKKTAQPATP